MPARLPRRWEADELGEIAAANIERCGSLLRLARAIDRSPSVVMAKKLELEDARRSRARCPAFLPDDGVPYRFRMTRILAERKQLPDRPSLDQFAPDVDFSNLNRGGKKLLRQHS